MMEIRGVYIKMSLSWVIKYEVFFFISTESVPATHIILAQKVKIVLSTFEKSQKKCSLMKGSWSLK